MLISRTPLRISFAGGGTDIPGFYSQEGGKVISSAINKFIYVVVKERFDKKIVLNYTKREVVDSVSELKHELVREALIETGITSGLEIWTPADIPSEGSGLGSSSTLTVGLLNAFYAYLGLQVDAERLASKACEIEINKLKKPIGKQDQYIAAYGGMNEITFHKNDKVTVDPIILSKRDKYKFESNILLFFSGVTRQSSMILESQSENTPKNMRTLKQMKQQVSQIKKIFNDADDFDQIGYVLDKAWQKKKNLAENITNSKLDVMYNLAKNAGATGGKITGAGGGGFLCLYVPLENQETVRDALREYKELPLFIEPHGSKIIFNI